jgi:hypothetical protein
VFLTLMVIGLIGLAAMAIPAFGHGHGALSGHGVGHGGVMHGAAHGALAHGAAHGAPTSGVGGTRGELSHLLPADPAHETRWRFVPSPRAIFSVLALYGAFGNAAVRAFHLPTFAAAFAAVVPALLVEWVLVRPLWNVVFRLQADASSPLEQLVLAEAEAVVPFKNGRGMISTVRDGRRVQLAARLRKDQEARSVRVGDRLLIEDVDATRERVTVSIPPD